MRKLIFLTNRKLRKRIEAIRAKPRPEPLNESHAREMIARKLVLPEAKRFFGDNLFAVAIAGSTQVGLRKASRTRPDSDLDLTIAVEKSDRKRNNSFGKRISKKAHWLAGIKLTIAFLPAEKFVIEELDHRFRCQIIYGEEKVNEMAAKASRAHLLWVFENRSGKAPADFVRRVIERKPVPKKEKHS